MQAPNISGTGLRLQLPDHLQSRQAGRPEQPFPLAVPKTAEESEDEGRPKQDVVTISPEARALNQRSARGEAQEAGAEQKDGKGRGVSTGKEEPDAEEQREVAELQRRDREVRSHEQAHKAAAGHLSTTGPTYTYDRGPDGRRYAVGGEVGIQLREGRTPEQTLNNARAARRAALSPADPSPQDRKVAARARAMEREARQEIAEERSAGKGDGQQDDAGVDAPVAPTGDGPEDASRSRPLDLMA